MVFENLIGKPVRISYFNYRNNERLERFIYCRIVAEEETLIQVEGLADGKIFVLNKEHIIEVKQEEERNHRGDTND